MVIIARRSLCEFWESPGRGNSEQALKAWFAEVKAADWSNPAELKTQFRSASILKSGRVVFNICGNKYRLVVWVNYCCRTIYIKFVGTHAEYDAIDVESI